MKRRTIHLNTGGTLIMVGEIKSLTGLHNDLARMVASFDSSTIYQDERGTLVNSSAVIAIEETDEPVSTAARVIDGDGDVWTRQPDGLYAFEGDPESAHRSLGRIRDLYDIRSEG